MLIIEGPDCVGKTTFAKNAIEMSERMGQKLEYLHHGPELAGSLPYEYLHKYRRHCVCDRFHVSEYAYDRVCRGGEAPLANGFLLERTSKALRAIGAVTVLILPTIERYEVILEGVHCRGEMYSLEQCMRVRDEFEFSQMLCNPQRIMLSADRPFFTNDDVIRVVQDYLHVQAMMESGL